MLGYFYFPGNNKGEGYLQFKLNNLYSNSGGITCTKSVNIF